MEMGLAVWHSAGLIVQRQRRMRLWPRPLWSPTFRGFNQRGWIEEVAADTGRSGLGPLYF